MESTIGPYQVKGEIGRGGMGVVFRATDPRLGREVAIKALPEDLATDPGRLERFEREARALAQVSHSNIAGIYGVEEQAGKRYLVLEFVPGETLADKIDRGPIELHEAVDLASQIAAGVGAAHDAGVIHRDLKPANIRITPDGVVKVLDFGLARQDEGKSSTAVDTHLPTITTPPHHHSPTNAGVILGTAAYMSPEQARGRRVDKRTDIWSFGVVLYEMLTGASPFIGETATDSIGAVLHKDPDLSRVPASMRHILERCLHRDKDQRFRDIGDVGIELRDALKHGPAAAAKSGRLPIVVALLAALAFGVLGAAAAWLAKPGAPGQQVRLSVAAPPNLNVANAWLCPTGKTVLYGALPAEGAGRSLALLRRLDDFEPTVLPGPRGAFAPAFSPSGAWLSYMSPVTEGSSELRLVKYAVGKDLPPVPIAVLPDSAAISGYNGVWLTEDTIVFSDARTNQFRLVSAATGTVSDPVKIDMGAYPGNFEVFLNRIDDTRALCGLFRYTANGYQQDIGIVDTAAARLDLLLENSAVAAIGPDGSLLFSRGSTLYGATLDLAGRTVGTPVQLIAGLRTIGPYQDARFQVARDGTLCFLPGGEQGAHRRLMFRLPDGSSEPLPLEARAFEEAVTSSRDESRLLVVVCSPGKLFEIWGTELETPRLRRVRGVAGSDLNYPAFAGDNDTFVYLRSAGDKTGIEAASFDGTFEPYWVVEPVDGLIMPASVDPVRGTVVCIWERPDYIDFYKVDLAKGGTPVRLFAEPANRTLGRFSPDGSMFAYLSDETGREEAYVCSVREDGSLGRPVAVTTIGATGMNWENSGASMAPSTKSDEAKALTLYVGSSESVTRYEVTPGERPRVSAGEILPYDRRGQVGSSARLSGGRLLCIVRGENETPATHAQLILNWYGSARKLIRGR